MKNIGRWEVYTTAEASFCRRQMYLHNFFKRPGHLGMTFSNVQLHVEMYGYAAPNTA